MPKKQLTDPPETYIFPPAIHIGAGSAESIEEYISQWNSSKSSIIGYSKDAPFMDEIQKSSPIPHRLLLDPIQGDEESDHIGEVLEHMKAIDCDLIIAYGDHTIQWAVKLATLAWAEELHPPKSSRDTAYRPMTPLISMVTSPWKGLTGEALVQIEHEHIIEQTLYPKAVIMDPTFGTVSNHNITHQYHMTVAMTLMGVLQLPPTPYATVRGKMILDYYANTYMSPSLEDLFFLSTQTTALLQMNYQFPLALIDTLETTLNFPKESIGIFIIWATYKRSPHMEALIPSLLSDDDLQALQKYLYQKLKSTQITPDLREITKILVPLGSSKGELTLIKDILDGVDWYLRGRECL